MVTFRLKISPAWQFFAACAHHPDPMTEHKIDIPQILSRIPLFHELDEGHVAQIAEGTRERKLARGEMLFNKGDLPKGFFVIVAGQIKLAFPSAQGNEKVVEVMGPRQSFGEAVMFADKPYPIFAEAIAETLLLQIGKAVVNDLIENDKTFARRLLAGLSQRLHGLIHDVESYSLRSSAQRVIGYLLQHCPADGECTGALEFELPISKQLIASRLNLTPETLSRIFHDLADGGLITVQGKRIRIHDVGRLRAHD